MLLEERRAEERDVGEERHLERHVLAELLADVVDADERREAEAEEAQREPGRVLVGVEPDHEHAEDRGEDHPGAGPGRERDPLVARMEGGGEAGDRRDQHHPFGAEVEDARLLVDQQPQARERERRARGDGRGDEERDLVHDATAAR